MAAADTGETTVTVQTEKRSAGPIPLAEFTDRAAGLGRLRSRQLSVNVGGTAEGSPDCASLKISGDLRVERDLLRGEHVTVTVTD